MLLADPLDVCVRVRACVVCSDETDKGDRSSLQGILEKRIYLTPGMSASALGSPSGCDMD